jgi:hypothetical protein
MITILLAIAKIDAGGLQVTVGDGTDPYIGPGGWYYNGTDTFDVFFFSYGLVLVHIHITTSFFESRYTRLTVGHIYQVGYGGSAFIISVYLQKFFMRNAR